MAAKSEEPRSLDYQHIEMGDEAPPRVCGGDILACGFGMTVAAWIVAYLSRMPLVNAPGQVTVGLMLAMVFLGGIFAARYSNRGLVAALLAGVVSGVLDILVVGSVLHDVSVVSGGGGGAVAPAAGLWIGGSILCNTVVAGLGGGIGMFWPSGRRKDIRWTAVFAIVLTAATLPLITAGGLVTAFRAGLAVPDWPQSYGYNMFLFPLSKMQSAQGNFYEHAHRLMGSLVGLTSLVVAEYATVVATKWNVRQLSSYVGIHVIVIFCAAAAEVLWRSGNWAAAAALGAVAAAMTLSAIAMVWLKNYGGQLVGFAWIIFVAVCVQGILGGTRVTEKSLALAVIHGIFAQLVFAAMATLAAAAGRSFAKLGRTMAAEAPTDRMLAMVLVALMLLQLTLGALVRHYDVMVLLHVCTAAVVALLAFTCGFRAAGLHAKFRPLKRAGIAVMVLVSVQLLLGVLALALRPGPGADPTATSAIWTTAHQANGAILLAACVMLCFWNWRLLVPAERASAPSGVDSAAESHAIGLS